MFNADSYLYSLSLLFDATQISWCPPSDDCLELGPVLRTWLPLQIYGHIIFVGAFMSLQSHLVIKRTTE